MFFSFFSPISIYSLLRVYPVEGPGTSVELHILITHLYTGENGAPEFICTGEWVELPSSISWHAETLRAQRFCMLWV